MKKKYNSSLLFLFLILLNQDLLAIESNTVIATLAETVPLGDPAPGPDGIAQSPDGKFIYVVNNNNNTVSVIEIATNTFVNTLTGFDAPTSIAMDHVRNVAYVSNSGTGAGQNTVSIIDLATNTISGTITGLFGPGSIELSPDGSFAYIANYGFINLATPGNTISVVDLDTYLITDTITVNDYPTSLAISPDGNNLYASCYVDGQQGTGTIEFIDLQTMSVDTTLAGLSGPYALSLYFGGVVQVNHPILYASNYGTVDGLDPATTISVIDTESKTITQTIDVGARPTGMFISPATGELLVNTTDIATNQGAVISRASVDISRASVDTGIAVGTNPLAITILSSGDYAYVTNNSSNSISVIALAPFILTARGCRMSNIFLFGEDLINQITWNALSTSEENLPTVYTLYKDNQMQFPIATIPANRPHQFLHHNVQPGIIYIYYLTGTNAANITSSPIPVPVTQYCIS